MTVAHASKGFTGTVDEVEWAALLGLAAPPFRVASATDWLPSANVSLNRTVNVAPGKGYVPGVSDTTPAQDQVVFDPNTTSVDRLDVLVASIPWTDYPALGLTAHTTSFRVIKGTSAPPQVNATTTVDNTKINRIKGQLYDALIAVVRVRPSVGPFSSGDVVDCRMWAGYEGYALTGSAQYLTLLDTFVGSLVRDMSTDIVWNRLTSTTWGFEKWCGTDRTKQPMLSVRNTSGISSGLVDNNTPSPVPVFWVDLTDHSGGLFTLQSDRYIRCEKYGRVRVEANAFSNSSSEGVSYLRLALPAGGGNYFSALEDERVRSTAFSGAGFLRQTITTGPLQVQPGDLFDLQAQQVNQGGGALAYQFWMTATYV